jgi:hypothetical protein
MVNAHLLQTPDYNHITADRKELLR